MARSLLGFALCLAVVAGVGPSVAGVGPSVADAAAAPARATAAPAHETTAPARKTAAPARATAAPARKTVAVLPMVASGPELELYSRAIASAVAAELGRRLDREVVVLASASAVPPHVAFVVHGRIVAVPGDAVLLEARLRDPDGGDGAAPVASGRAPLTRVDRLAQKLAADLAAQVARAERDPVRLPETVVQGAARASAPPADPRPALVITRPTGVVAGGLVAIAKPASAVAADLARRLGHRGVALATVPGSPAELATALGAAGATRALVLEIEGIEFSFRGVLAARGVVRVRLVDAAGALEVDRRVHTDTVVGNRGDRHAALVRLVVAQALDVAGPDLERALSR